MRWCLRDGASSSASVRYSVQILRIGERWGARKVNGAERFRRNFLLLPPQTQSGRPEASRSHATRAQL